jgi:hypothetical protein
MKRETLTTLGFLATAVLLSAGAVLVQPERHTPRLLSDEGEPFYPKFKDPNAVKSVEVIDYEESTATARPFRIEFQRGRWVLPSHNNYPVEVGDRLIKTAVALMDLRKDMVRSDSPQEHGKYGVIDPLDAKVPELAGRGKRVTLRDGYKEVIADFIFGKPVEGKAGYRFARLPGQKRVYAVKTEAEPSADFSDWVTSGAVRIAPASLRRISILAYNFDDRLGGVSNMENITLTREGDEWKTGGGEQPNTAAIQSLTRALENLKVVDIRQKPEALARELKEGKLQLSLETALALRQKGFFIASNGRLLAAEGEISVETANGLVYSLRFGDAVATGSDAKPAAVQPNRYLFVTVTYDAERAAKYGDTSGSGERLARELNARYADWFYIIRGADLDRLRPRRKDLLK